MDTEYDHIESIGSTYELGRNITEKKLGLFFHQQQTKTVSKILTNMDLKNYDRVIDLGCSNGGWFKDYQNLGFKKIIGIDVSEDRIKQAKERGFHETYVTNAYSLPFDNKSENLIISNGMFVHVLQESDRLKILKEVSRVLKKMGCLFLTLQMLLETQLNPIQQQVTAKPVP